MTTTPFDLNDAKQKASKKSDEDLVLAAGHAGNALDDILNKLVESGDMSSAHKTAALNAITAHAAEIVKAAIEGQTVRSLDSGSDSSAPATRRSGDEDRDSSDKLEKAEAARQTAEGNVKVLVKGVESVLGGNVTYDTNGVLKTDVKAELEKVVKKAQESAVPDDSVKKSDVKAELDKIETAAKAESARIGTIKGHDELEKAVKDARVKLVS